MKIAITGANGFLGGQLANELTRNGHQIVRVTRIKNRHDSREGGFANFDAPIGLANEDKLVQAFAGCDTVAHCAGINRELGEQTYARVHVDGTRNVVNAAKRAGVKKVILISFLRARPNCGSKYHESKWAAEELVRACGLDFTILKCGVIYGRGDHMLDHLSHAFYTFPIFALVGMQDQLIRPTAVEDVVKILMASITEARLSRQTVSVVGPEELTLSCAVKRVAEVLDKHPLMVRLPLAFHYALGCFLERIMRVPLVSIAQVRILSEGIVNPWLPCEKLPEDLLPRTRYTKEQIRRGLPEPGAFGIADLRCCGGAT
jgi:nucleoside-diphosphate-sugar epimerase